MPETPAPLAVTLQTVLALNGGMLSLPFWSGCMIEQSQSPGTDTTFACPVIGLDSQLEVFSPNPSEII